MPSTRSDVASWYDDNVSLEDSRLKLGRLEYGVTMRHIQEAVTNATQAINPARPIRIADIGCGTGVYAIPLAQAGHEVTICDVSPAEVELAKNKAQEAGLHFSHAVAFDAREMTHHPEIYVQDYYDVALLLGPMYHILDEAERIGVLVSTLRTVRCGGFLLAAFVTRNAHLRDVATRDPNRLQREAGFYSQYLVDGKYTRGTHAPMHHTTSQEVRQLLEKTNQHGEVSAELLKMLSCEGFLGFQHGSHLADLSDEAFQPWLDIILASAAHKTTLGAADHILVVLRKM